MEQQNKELSIGVTNNEETVQSITGKLFQSIGIKRLRWFYISQLLILLLLFLSFGAWGLFNILYGVIGLLVSDPDVIVIATFISWPLLLIISIAFSFSKSITPLKKIVILLPIFQFFLLFITIIFLASVSEFEYLRMSSLREKIKQYNIEVNDVVASLEEEIKMESPECGTFSDPEPLYGEGPCLNFKFFINLENANQTPTGELKAPSDDIAKLEKAMQDIVSIRDKFFTEKDNVPFIFQTRFHILVISENGYSQWGKRETRRYEENCKADKEAISCSGNINGFSVSTLIKK